MQSCPSVFARDDGLVATVASKARHRNPLLLPASVSVLRSMASILSPSLHTPQTLVGAWPSDGDSCQLPLPFPASVSDHVRSFLSASPYSGSPYCLEFQGVTVALHSPVMRTFDAPLARFLNGCAEYYESTFGRTCKTPKQSCVVTCQGPIPCRSDRLVAVTCRFRS